MSKDVHQAIQITVAIPNRVVGRHIAQQLLERQLAACIQISGPIESHYVWQGKIEKSEEYLLFIKTHRRYYDEVELTVLSIHPYEVPEIIQIEITDGLKEYLDWVNDQIK